MLRSKNLAELEMPEDDPWMAILASVAYAMHSTYHTTLQATPAQLVFGRDMIYPIEYVAEWDVIRQKKQKVIDQNNARENSRRIDFDYRVGQKILIINTDIQRKLDNPTMGPYKITDVFSNGTVCIRRGNVLERLNIRRIKPYHEGTENSEHSSGGRV